MFYPIRSAGMDSHIGKPFERLDLLAAIDRAGSAEHPVRTQPREEADELVFERTTYASILHVVDLQQMGQLLDSLLNLLDERFADPQLEAADQKELAALARDVFASSGMLGILQPSRSCAKLEEVCLSGGDRSAALACVKSLRRLMLDAIAELRAA
jgi:hypothetical protein